MPFITEEIWTSLPLPARPEPSLVIASWPKADVRRREGGLWQEEQKLLPADPDSEDRFGHDVAISGDGEATSSLQLPDVIELTARVLSELDLPRDVELVLITNGSMVHREHVRTSLERLTADAAQPDVNLMPAIIDAARARATEEEIVMAMEKVFGTYVERAVV